MTTQSNKNVAIAYMPYLFMDGVDEIDFGFLKIWNFDKKKDVYITNQAARTHIEKLLGTHKTHHGNLNGIGVITIGTCDFSEFNDDDFEKIRLARLILFISCIAQTNIHKADGNIGHSMVTSENFDLVYQRFVLGDDHISDSSGTIVRILSGGFNVNTVSFQKPGFVLSPGRFDVDKTLLASLLDLRLKKPRAFNRIINSAEIFFESYYNAPDVSRNTRILLQLSAFEILLDLPNDGMQRKNLKDAIANYSNETSDKLYVHKYEKRGGAKGTETITIKQIWADVFYTLRNHIIHGDTPKPQNFWFKGKQLHTDIGVLFFVLCIKKQIGMAIKKYNCTDEINWEKWTNPTGMKPPKGEGFVYKRNFPQLWAALAKELKKKK